MKCGISLCLTKEWNCLDYHVKYYYYIKSNCTYKTSIFLYQGLDISYLPERLDKTSFLLCSLSFLYPYLMLLKICNKSEKAYKKWNFFQKLTFVSSRDYKEAKLWSKCAGQRVKLVQFACDLMEVRWKSDFFAISDGWLTTRRAKILWKDLQSLVEQRQGFLWLLTVQALSTSLTART